MQMALTNLPRAWCQAILVDKDYLIKVKISQREVVIINIPNNRLYTVEEVSI
jgi:hypothetical protein